MLPAANLEWASFSVNQHPENTLTKTLTVRVFHFSKTLIFLTEAYLCTNFQQVSCSLLNPLLFVFNFVNTQKKKQPLANVFRNNCFKNFAIFTGKHLC